MFKKLTACLGLIAATACGVRAQSTEPINFSIRHLPQTSYEVYSNSQTSTSITLVGVTPAAKKNLLAKGVSKPIINVQKKEMQTKTVIGKSGADNEAPVSYIIETIKNTKIADDGETESINPLQSTVFQGKCTAAGKLQLDSMINQNYTAVDKKAIVNSVNALLNQVQYPSKMMHPGDSFTQDMTINMPLGTNQMKILVKATYTLQKHVDSLAYIDIKQVLSFNFNIGKDQKVQAGGGGTGRMVYNINNQYAELSETDLSINMATVMNDTRTTINVKITNAINTKVHRQMSK
jgi:hypothetical protein